MSYNSFCKLPFVDLIWKGRWPMDDAGTEVLTVTFPVTADEQALLSGSALAMQLQQTHQNLAGQLAHRSQRIYQNDVAAFLWWLRAYQAGETPGRYKQR